MNDAKKVWFVTGASSGFGLELVEEILGRGERVVAAVRTPASLEKYAQRDDVLVLRLDVTKGEEIASAVRTATERFGRIDVLVNNAGFSILGAVEETSEKDLRATMETMFFGPVALTRAVLPGMRERGAGTVVQITSVGGLTTAPGFGAYCAAKHALEGLSECMAKELAPLGVNVLVVEPGAFRTALFGSRFQHIDALPAYAATVGAMREWVRSEDGKQPGDPQKAARAIVETVSQQERGSVPLRLPLGADAIENLRAKLAYVESDIARTEKVARDTAL